MFDNQVNKITKEIDEMLEHLRRVRPDMVVVRVLSSNLSKSFRVRNASFKKGLNVAGISGHSNPLKPYEGAVNAPRA
jgi:hypothetical protein